MHFMAKVQGIVFLRIVHCCLSGHLKVDKRTYNSNSEKYVLQKCVTLH